MFKLEHIDHIALTVKDLERSSAWYREVLRLEQRHQGMWNGIPLLVGAGETCLALFPASTPTPLPPADHRTISLRHVAVRTARANFEQAQAERAQRDIPFSFEDHEICHSIYFHDPDSYRIEITTYDIEQREV
jgi:catechol 2,3-dioxygenase-like lactoylglutathione lyase family enzyme